MEKKVYQKIISILHGLEKIKLIELDDVIEVYDEFNIPEDEEIDLKILLKDIQLFQEKTTNNNLDPEQIKVKKIEKRYDELAKQAKALTNSATDSFNDFYTCNKAEEKELIADEKAREAKQLLDKLDLIHDQYEKMN